MEELTDDQYFKIRDLERKKHKEWVNNKPRTDVSIDIVGQVIVVCTGCPFDCWWDTYDMRRFGCYTQCSGYKEEMIDGVRVAVCTWYNRRIIGNIVFSDEK